MRSGFHKKDHYLEDWCNSEGYELPSRTSTNGNKVTNIIKPFNDNKTTNTNKATPVSVILSTQGNFVLNKENNYELKFNVGMSEGEGITVNDMGNLLTFFEPGSYKFEISGQAMTESELDADLIYFNKDFAKDVALFSKLPVPRVDTTLNLRGIPTILPLEKGDTISIKLLPTKEESILLSNGTRLLVYRVA